MLPVIPCLQSKVIWDFADNRIVVRISRENGSRVFAKTFTKQSFSGFVSADHLRHFILEGVVFDEEKTREGKKYHIGCQCELSSDRFVYSFLYHYYS